MAGRSGRRGQRGRGSEIVTSGEPRGSGGEAAPADTRFAKMQSLGDRYMTERNFGIVQKLQDFVNARGKTMLELAFSWLAARPQVSSVIAGATRVEQIEQNAKAIGWKLTAEELAEIDTITRG